MGGQDLTYFDSPTLAHATALGGLTRVYHLSKLFQGQSTNSKKTLKEGKQEYKQQ